jgi:hypothetical protein
MEMPQGQMVSGHYVAANLLQHLAKLLQGYNAKKEMEGYDQQQQDIVNGEREKQTAAAKALAQALSPQQVQQPISYEDAGGMPGAEQTVTQQPTQDQVFGALGNYYSQVDPSQLGSIALEKLKYGQADQAREDQQQFNRENLNLQLTTATQARQEAREQRAQELQLRLQDAQVSRQEQATARKELAQMQIDARRDLMQLTQANRPEPAVSPVTVMEGGKPVIKDARTGRVIGEAPAAGFGKPMSSVAQKELIETDEQIQGGQAALDLFKQAQDINSKAMGFKGAGAVASVGSLLPESMRPASVDATNNLDNILQSAALPQLKAIFGGMPTEGERAILLDVQGSSSKSPAVRKAIFDRAETAIKNRLKFAQDKSKSLRTGNYFAGDGGVDPAAPAPAPAAPAKTIRFNKEGKRIP